jgi:hypothetical protein
MAGRTTGTIGVSTVGDIDWVDLSDNWRQFDAEWLQARSIVRIPSADTTSGTAYLNSTEAGRVFYQIDSDRLILRSSASATAVKTILSSVNLSVSDVSSTVELSSGGGSNPKITLGTSSISVSSDLNVIGYLSGKASTAGTFSTGSTGVVINTTGSNAVTLTTGADGLILSTGISVTGGVKATTASSFTGGITVPTGGLTVTLGNITVASGLTNVQAVTAGGLITANAGLTVATGASSLQAVTAAALITANGGITMSASGATTTLATAAGKSLAITVPVDQSIRITAPSTADTYANRIYYGSTSVQNAWVYYGTDPGVAVVPEGTIWIS